MVVATGFQLSARTLRCCYNMCQQLPAAAGVHRLLQLTCGGDEVLLAAAEALADLHLQKNRFEEQSSRLVDPACLRISTPSTPTPADNPDSVHHCLMLKEGPQG